MRPRAPALPFTSFQLLGQARLAQTLEPVPGPLTRTGCRPKHVDTTLCYGRFRLFGKNSLDHATRLFESV